MIDFTTVVALDRAHLEQWKITWPTWARHRPEILERPLVVIADAHPDTGGNHAFWDRELRFLHPLPTGFQFLVHFWHAPFSLRSDLRNITQRERMLTSLVRVPPAVVKTPYWLKLDTDAIALRPADWCQDAWFEDDPVFASSPWGYAKPPDVIQRLDAWGDQHPELSRFPALGHRPEPGSDIVRYSRMISWCAWFRTDWTNWVASLSPPPERLPVPSQDTFTHYVAARAGHFWRAVKMKSHGWAHVRKDGTLRRLAAEALK